jgi:hypothetical protein
MRIFIILLILGLFLGGCATLYAPYPSSTVSDPYKEIREYNDSFFKVYHSDLRSWVGKTVGELDQAFTAKGSSSLDVYGNGTIIHEVINPGASYGLPTVNARLIFYVKKNKIYNVVKE